MTAEPETELSVVALRVLGLLEGHGMLLVQDAKLPNLVSEVVGCSVRGSWWGHPASHEIFRVLNEVADHRDTFIATLLNKKRTLLHRALFAPLLVVGRAREAWQMNGMSEGALELLARVDRGEYVLASGDQAQKLELAMLVASREVHTESGAHAKELVSWEAFGKLQRVAAGRRSPAQAKAEFEKAAEKLAAPANAKVQLPWQTAAPRR